MKIKQYVGCALYMIAKHLPVSYGKFGGLWKSCRGGATKLMLPKCGDNVNIKKMQRSLLELKLETTPELV